jgi:leader peptidase (prepilin peptidase)/N-methyltransferase
MIDFYLFTAVYLLMLAGAAYFDVRRYIIPDWITLPGIGVALFYCLVNGFGISDIVLRILSTGGLFFAVGFLTSCFLKKETIGGGDIKLMTAVGLFKGWEQGLFIILLSAFSALVSSLVLAALKKRKLEEPIPFGFFIAVCGVLVDVMSL